jgi:hypothetical protein
MIKVDLRAERKDLYSPGCREFSLVEVPLFSFFMVDGQGDPNTSAAYAEAIGALYAVSYAAKFVSKAALDRDYVVAPLEGLWDSERIAAYADGSRDEWRWTMMIRQPDWISGEMADDACETAAKKKIPGLDLLRFAPLEEGLSAQILYIGSYADEAPTIARLHAEFLPANSLVENGPHHEIYLSDPRRVDPAKLRTVLRQPVRRV